MKKMLIAPKHDGGSMLIQFSEKAALSKDMCVTVPASHKAVVIVDEKMLLRIDPCAEKNLFKELGKDYLSRQVQVAFILAESSSELLWGLGNIQVNNDRIKEAYRVGANGKYIVEIVEYAKLIKSFGNACDITVDMVREKTLSTVKAAGILIIGKRFANTNTSVFEINALNSEIRNEFKAELKKEKIFSDLGIEVKELTVDSFHVNEEDLNIIRNRINA